MAGGQLAQRVAIVTGASRGIGRAIALAFAAEGARVVVNYHREEAKACMVAGEIERAGGRALPARADISDAAAVQAMVEQTVRNFGSIDILVNNAGVLLAKGSLFDFSRDEYDRMWDVNVMGTLHCTRAAAAVMLERRYGRIINIVSLAAFGTALAGGSLAYATTKAAIVAITKCCALELGAFGVNVNAIAPGLTRTDMGTSAPVSATAKQNFEDRTIVGRLGEPEDIAGAALFLASDKAGFITGQVITVDGGRKDFLSHSA